MQAHPEETQGPSPPPPLAVGGRLGKYQVVRLIGEGGMGAVYEGIHTEIGKRVAIKMMSPALAEIPDARARFLREAQLTSRVRHPHAVDVTDLGIEDGQTFLVMEYLEGEDLAFHIGRRGPMPLGEVVDIMLPVLGAVVAAHDEGIVHRDLKPQNIFLARTREGGIHPKVLDFGISKGPADVGPGPLTTIPTSLVKTVGIIGSPSYFSPEQVQGTAPLTAASDQYALGTILYECVTGRLPHPGDELAAVFAAILRGQYRPAHEVRPDLPEPFELVIAKAMAIEPADRYPSVRELGHALLPFASEKTRLVWEETFGEAALRAHAAGRTGRPSPVPVTVQTPGPPVLTPAPTVAMDTGVPTPAGPGVRLEPTLEVPRRFRVGFWALGVVLLLGGGVAVALLASDGGLGAGRMLPPAATAPAPATPRPAATAGVATPPVVAMPAAPPAPEGAEAEAAAPSTESSGEPSDERSPAAETRARPGKKARFGANKAPIIE